MRNLLILMLICLLPGIGLAQQSMSFTLKQAQDYAVEHNYQMQSARLDLETADLTVKETLSAGLPQINASASLNDNLKIMTTLIPAEMFGGAPGTYQEIQFGTQYNTSWGVQATQLLFNGPVIVGIQTAKVYRELSEQGVLKTKNEILETVANTYYITLLSEKSMGIIVGNIENLKATLKQTETMYAAGMVEATDVDQIRISLTMMENTQRSMQRNIELNYNLFRFQLGLTGDTEIALSETLDSVMEQVSFEAILAQQFLVNSNVEYNMIETQERLALLNIKAQKAQYLPTLSGFYTYNQSGQGDELYGQSWFPNSILGLQLDIPIFAGGKRRATLGKAKVELKKIENTKNMVQEQLLLQERQLRFNLNNALEKYSNEEDNVVLAKRVMDNIYLKYKQGIVSSLDLTQANSNYLQAENNHISALMEVLQAKVALDKLLNNI